MSEQPPFQHQYRRKPGLPGLVLGCGLVSGFTRHFHLDYHFGIVTQGLQRQRFQQHNVLLGASAISCMPPGEMHDGKAEQGSHYELLTFRLAANSWHALLQECAEDKAAAEMAPVALLEPELARRMISWYRACTAADVMPLALETEWLELAAQLAQATRAYRPNAAAEKSTRLAATVLTRLYEYAQAHLGQALSLDELASLAGLNRFQFLRAFKQSTGMTPYAWLKCLRLEQACSLLQQVASARMTIVQVAHEVGFYDQSHFNRAFRQRYGVAPSAY